MEQIYLNFKNSGYTLASFLFFDFSISLRLCAPVAQLREKISTLEQSLGHVVREFETEQTSLVTKTNIETESSRAEIAKLQKILELKTKEMNKVKKLARNILEQRTETERFFLEALNDVKKEIAAHR